MPASQDEVTTACQSTVDEILGSFAASDRPGVARILVELGYPIRSEFRSEGEAEAFWAHVGEGPEWCHVRGVACSDPCPFDC